METTKRIQIYTPSYNGERFNEHRFPLDLIEDLAVLEDLTLEMAKHIYREKHQDRTRVPRDFTKGISFELESIEKGSSIPKIVIMCQMAGMFIQNPHIEYFEKAGERVVELIQAVDENNTNLLQIAPEKILNYFSRIGKKLEKNEFIEFNPNGGKSAIYNKEIRKKIIQASSTAKEYNEDLYLRGYISELDFVQKTFTIDLVNGQRYKSEYNADIENDLKIAFNTFNTDSKQKVLIEANVRFNKSDTIIKLEHTDKIFELEDKDVGFRLEEFVSYREGWFNGEGKVFDNQKIQDLTSLFDKFFDSKLPLPNTFPTPDGNIQFEWVNDLYDLSILVYLNDDFDTEFHLLIFEDDVEKEYNLKLNSPKSWNIINQELQVLNEISNG